MEIFLPPAGSTVCEPKAGQLIPRYPQPLLQRELADEWPILPPRPSPDSLWGTSEGLVFLPKTLHLWQCPFIQPVPQHAQHGQHHLVYIILWDLCDGFGEQLPSLPGQWLVYFKLPKNRVGNSGLAVSKRGQDSRSGEQYGQIWSQQQQQQWTEWPSCSFPRLCPMLQGLTELGGGAKDRTEQTEDWVWD